jgi:hypothetical protein
MKKRKIQRDQSVQLQLDLFNSAKAAESVPPKANVVHIFNKRFSDIRDELVRDLIASKVPEKKQG